MSLDNYKAHGQRSHAIRYGMVWYGMVWYGRVLGDIGGVEMRAYPRAARDQKLMV